MKNDTWLSIFVFSLLISLLLIGCVPNQTKNFLVDFQFLSGWIQAVGSVAAVWATAWVFYTQLRFNAEEADKKNKIEQEKFLLKANTLIVNDDNTRKLVIGIHSFVTSVGRSNFDNSTALASKIVAEFDSFRLNALSENAVSVFVDAYGIKAIELQRSILNICLYVGYLRQSFVESQYVQIQLDNSKNDADTERHNQMMKKIHDEFRIYSQEILKEFPIILNMTKLLLPLVIFER